MNYRVVAKEMGMKRMDVVAFVFLFVGGTCLPAAAAVTPQRGHEIVAVWDHGSLTATEIAWYSQVVRYPYADPVATMRTSSDAAERKDAASFVEQIAKERAWEAFVAAEARQSSPSLEALAARFSHGVFNSCVAEKWRRHIAESFTTPTTEEILSSAFRMKDRFERPELREVQYIFRSTTGTTTQQERDRIRRELEEVRQEIITGKLSFAEAARLHSEAPSSAQGGKLGIVSKQDRYNKKFLDFIFSLKEDEISTPTLLHNGYYMALVKHVYPAFSITTESLMANPQLQSDVIAAMRSEYVAKKIAELGARNKETTAISEADIAKAALETMTTPTECAEKERFLRERILARTWFLDSQPHRYAATEFDARDYYTTYSNAMREGGTLKYTRFFVPYGTSRYPTRGKAKEALEHFRELVATSAPRNLAELKKLAEREGVEISQVQDWVLATEEEKADDELIKLHPGDLTKIYLVDKGVAFYRLDDRRERPKVTFEAARDFCMEQARNRKAWEFLQQSINEFAEKHHVRIVIPLPN